jgi:hypothetical protein
MSNEGNIQFLVIFTVPEEQVAEGDRIFESHEQWMNETHYKGGEKALLSYNVSKTREKEDPMDPDSDETGNTVFVLSEVYENPVGLEDHWEQSEDWDDMGAIMEWMETGDVTMVNGAEITHSLW